MQTSSIVSALSQAVARLRKPAPNRIYLSESLFFKCFGEGVHSIGDVELFPKEDLEENEVFFSWYLPTGLSLANPGVESGVVCSLEEPQSWGN